MRYTLRLLTLQQFQRAAALICACELHAPRAVGKGETPSSGGAQTPFRIGLWVGQASTPNRTEDAEQWVKQARATQRRRARRRSPMQLARCPWCGARARAADATSRSTATVAGRCCPARDTLGQCPFTPRNSPDEGMPVVVVDEEIYRLLPALVIATVDKFAQMPWKGRAQTLFGQVSRRCERHGYPDAGRRSIPRTAPQARRRCPRSTVDRVRAAAAARPDHPGRAAPHRGPARHLVGLYETAVDELCCVAGRRQRCGPKVIASTATIRRAGDQVHAAVRAQARGLPAARPRRRATPSSRCSATVGRRSTRAGCYLGICAPGRRFKAVLIRVYVAQLAAAQDAARRSTAHAADPWMTLVGYFNSLRELGGMRRLVEDDVQSRAVRQRERRGLSRAAA